MNVKVKTETHTQTYSQTHDKKFHPYSRGTLILTTSVTGTIAVLKTKYQLDQASILWCGNITSNYINMPVDSSLELINNRFKAVQSTAFKRS